jgi:surface protein
MDSRNTRAEQRSDDKSAATASAASAADAEPPPLQPPLAQQSLPNVKFALAMTRASVNSNDNVENDDEQGMGRKETASSSMTAPNPPSPPPGQVSLLNAKFALAVTRALGNSNVDDNNEEQGIKGKETPDHTTGSSARRTNVERSASHASSPPSIRLGAACNHHSKLERRPRVYQESEMYIDASESSDIPTSQTRSAMDEENIATARLVEQTQIRESALPVTGQLVVRATPVQQLGHKWRRHRRPWYGGVAVCAVLVIVLIAIVRRATARLRQSSPPSELQPTTTAPMVYSLFTTTEQLYDAVDAYMLAMEEDLRNNRADATPLAQSNVSLTYSYPIGTWDVSRLTNFSRVFDPDRSATSVRASTFNQDLSGWDVSSAVTMERMFAGAENFRGFGIDRWNVGRVQDFSYMFAHAKALNADMSKWNTSSATTTQGMFLGAETFNGNLAAWDVANVESMARMFSWALGFQGGDLTKWNVSKVHDMTELFLHSHVFIGDISTWDTSAVTTMNSMVRFVTGSSMHGFATMIGQSCCVASALHSVFACLLLQW